MRLFVVRISFPISIDVLMLHYFETIFLDYSFIGMQHSLYLGFAYR